MKEITYFCIDIGGSSIKYALMDSDFVFIKKGKRLLDDISSYAQMISLIHDLYESHGHPSGGIAVSYCGELDSQKGYLYNGGSFPFMAHRNFKEDLEITCNTKVNLENDGNCAAKAEVRSGSLMNTENAVVIIVGTGLAGSIVINRKIYNGSHNYAGFFSFLIKNIDKPFSISNIAARSGSANYLYDSYVSMTDKIDGESFFELIDINDTRAKEILEDYCSNLANLLFNLQIVLDVEKLCIGGGISVQKAFRIKLVEAYNKIYQLTPLHAINPAKAEVCFCKYHNDANLIGALIHHLELI